LIYSNLRNMRLPRLQCLTVAKCSSKIITITVPQLSLARRQPMATSTQPIPAEPAAQNMKESFLGRLLDPLDRLVEGIYSVLIVLTFTLAVRVVDANASIAVSAALAKELFWACFGCAVAWGLIDGVMYILASMAGRGQDLRAARTIRDAADETEGFAAFTEQLGILAPLTTPDEQRTLYSGLYGRLQ